MSIYISTTAHPFSNFNLRSVSHLCCDCVNEIVSEWVKETVRTCCCADDDKDDEGDVAGGVSAESACSVGCCHCCSGQSEEREK